MTHTQEPKSNFISLPVRQWGEVLIRHDRLRAIDVQLGKFYAPSGGETDEATFYLGSDTVDKIHPVHLVTSQWRDSLVDLSNRRKLIIITDERRFVAVTPSDILSIHIDEQPKMSLTIVIRLSHQECFNFFWRSGDDVNLITTAGYLHRSIGETKLSRFIRAGK
jgi:hypothetical protein